MPIHFPSAPATFINIPKVGTTSLRYWAEANVKDCDIVLNENNPNWVAHTSYDDMTARWGNLGTTFAFTRNPYDRLVSIFHHVGQDTEERIAFRKSGLRRPGVLAVPIEADIKILGLYKKGFDHWIHWLNDTHSDTNLAVLNLLANVKKETQLQWLQNKIPDIVIKLENINTEFSIIQNLVKCNEPFVHANTSSHKPYKEYYTKETQQIVEEWVKDDLQAFGYDF
jgi:hypothetical protein